MKTPSACIPAALSLNSPKNDHHENSINRVIGFGSGMAGALICGNGRRGQSLTLSDVKESRKAVVGSIGWGISNPKLVDTVHWRRLLPEMPHKKAFDQNGLRNLP